MAGAHTWTETPHIRNAWVHRGSDPDDLYGCMGVPQSISSADLKKTYAKAALALHPDKQQGNSQLFSQVGYAYSVLRDPEKRMTYNTHLVRPFMYGPKTYPAGFVAAKTALQPT